jgi:hypothetical protein
MPRQSSEARHFAVRSSPARLQPPPGLTPAEKKIFVSLVASVKTEHFVPSDLPLVIAYCHACALEIELARKLTTDDKALLKWERVCKTMASLSLRLRMSPQSRQPTISGARPNRREAPLSYFDRVKLESNGHDEQHDDQ